MPTFIGPQEYILVPVAVPALITPAVDETLDLTTGDFVSAYISGPFNYQTEVNVGIFGGNYNVVTPCPDPNPIDPIPAAADPPFPPVWPYMFSSTELYGRENINVITVMVRGDQYVMDLQAIQDSSDNALDLTGCELILTCKFNIDDPNNEALFQLSIGNGITITDAEEGKFTVTVPPEATLPVPLIKTICPFDIQFSLDDAIKTICRGSFLILPDITAG